MMDNTVVGNQIAFLRKQNNFTQEELGEKLGITAQAISKWENGHTLPETSLLPLLAKLFNCSIYSRPYTPAAAHCSTSRARKILSLGWMLKKGLQPQAIIIWL